jgi:RNA polymerase sigma-70 factor (ECF subfamily)
MSIFYVESGNGVSYCEISEKIGISENSARVIDFRTKKWLKSILKKEELI